MNDKVSPNRSTSAAAMSRGEKVALAAMISAAAIVFGVYFWNPFRSLSWNPWERLYGVGIFRNPSASMEPTIARGARLMANGWPYLANPPKVGDIVVFKFPVDPTIQYMKRIVASGGDTISISNCRVSLNGTLQSEPYISATGPDLKDLCELAEVTVPAGHYFVLGDNRRNSMDSRLWGFLPRENILGRVSP